MLAEVSQVNVLIVGASQGIGLGFVRSFLQQSNTARVFATYRRADTAVELLNLAGEQGERLQCIQVDVTQETQIAEAIRLN